MHLLYQDHLILRNHTFLLLYDNPLRHYKIHFKETAEVTWAAKITTTGFNIVCPQGPGWDEFFFHYVADCKSAILANSKAKTTSSRRVVLTAVTAAAVAMSMLPVQSAHASCIFSPNGKGTACSGGSPIVGASSS